MDLRSYREVYLTCSQRDAANQCGLSRKTWGELERGEIKNPSFKTMRKIKNGLNIPKLSAVNLIVNSVEGTDYSVEVPEDAWEYTGDGE